ncbi:carboxypeptidase-like regulatory domain-containing protein [Longimicrobium sp.]|uniref:carboxypeptidase-like regulatory domain-containing protein n=1 Tax=Longimicrobium sp. TaxID=2029185 RepID=UPI002BA09BE6|nr:carboxypeptidase-like regulatory domain-containing protein [Longimicrobium sp.]HSU17839.1 carboxypeptidase-like regulatory domain-containing protein [Longimicrobium sp.]
MQQRLVRILPLLLLAAAVPPAARAQQAAADLTVIVADTTTGQPIAGASVTAGRARGETNARGEAVFRAVPAGPVTVEARRLGYLAGRTQATVQPGAAQTVSVALGLDPVVLRRLNVTAATLPRSPLLRDFYIRKATWGSGRFLTRDDFGPDGRGRMSDAMRRIPGVYITSDGGRPLLRFGKNVPEIVGGECEPIFYLDGTRYGPVNDLDHEFQGLLIEGVEIYNGARIPPQFNGANSGCGVVVVWTRRTLAS